MNKCHQNVNWQNDTTPAINETNLNYMDGCIDTIDDRVVALANDPPANALKAEGWAIGEQSGVPVTSDSPYYENNSKYYSQESANEVLKSEGFANGTQNGTPVTSGSPYYENNAKYWKEQAQAIASSSLSGLSDVSITNPQDGEVLAYDASNSEWKNSSDTKAARTDITSIIATGATNTTGAQIPIGAFFYLNGVLCQAVADIDVNATYTKNTNYIETSINDVSTIEITPDTTYFTGTMGAQKCGHLVSVFGSITTKSSISTSSAIVFAILPTEYRPKTIDVRTAGFVNVGSVYESTKLIVIAKNGNILSILNGLASGKRIDFYSTYIV